MKRTLCMAALVLLVAACSSGLRGAKSDFKSGEYGRARERLEALEGDAKSWNDGAKAEYALYRGLTHHALGDRPRAAQWLGEAKRIEDLHPNTLSPDDRTRLSLALEALGPEAQP